jgi:hypothetical protein
MKLKKIIIPKNRDWRKILPQLNQTSYYLIKYVDKRWYRWFCSTIEPAGWIDAHCDTEEEKKRALLKPHSWEFSWGSHEDAFEDTSNGFAMKKDIKEIYEIVDPELNARIAKGLLLGRDEYEDE